jgi:chorismate mutase / prephenate dehydratase
MSGERPSGAANCTPSGGSDPAQAGSVGAHASLDDHRKAIDALDREILERLNARARHAQAIGELKGGALAYRPERETQVLQALHGANAGPLRNEHVTGIFREVMSACRALEQPLRVAYLGPAGTFSHAAVHKHFGTFVDAVALPTFDDVFRAVESGQADYGVVPIENSTEGAVGRTMDLMVDTELSVCGEVKLRVNQNLLSNAGGLDKITRVYSHGQSLAQCVKWLAQHLPAVPRIAVASNAEAARLASAEAGAAAIAGENAGTIYGLATLAPHIEDEPNNTTRFWVLGRQLVRASGRDETSIVMSCPNKPGAVHQLLAPFATHGVSMSRFESRPARTGRWEYLFFVDLVGHRDDAPVKAALGELAGIAPFLKLLGSYPASLD